MLAAAWLMLSSLLYSLQINTGTFPKPLTPAEEQHYLQRSADGDLEARNNPRGIHLFLGNAYHLLHIILVSVIEKQEVIVDVSSDSHTVGIVKFSLIKPHTLKLAIEFVDVKIDRLILRREK